MTETMSAARAALERRQRFYVTQYVAREVVNERAGQDHKWGEQRHPLGTSRHLELLADAYRDRCDRNHRDGVGTWLDILLEEVYEFAAETDLKGARKEAIQVAAVAVAIVEDIDRKVAEETKPAQPKGVTVLLARTLDEARNYKADLAQMGTKIDEIVSSHPNAIRRLDGLRAQKVYVAPGATEGDTGTRVLKVLERNLAKTPDSEGIVYL